MNLHIYEIYKNSKRMKQEQGDWNIQMSWLFSSLPLACQKLNKGKGTNVTWQWIPCKFENSIKVRASTHLDKSFATPRDQIYKIKAT